MQYLKSFLFFLIISLLPVPCFATEKIVVTPAFQEIFLSPNQVSFGEVEIQNKTESDQQFSVRAVNFNSLDLSGGVAFLGSDINSESLPLADFVYFENENFSVLAGETRKFSFEVKDREMLASGGHYAALVFQSLPVSEENTSKNIAVRQIFSALLFVEKNGGVTKELELTGFPRKNLYWILPKKFMLHFTNTGNTHVVPRGTVRLENFFGAVHSCGVLNEASSMILPNQERIIPAELKCQTLLPGRYNLRIAYRFDGKEEFTEINQAFWLLPYPLFLVIGIVIVLLLILRRKKYFLAEKYDF